MAAYDDQNIFAKIIRGEIPCDKVYEDDHVLAGLGDGVDLGRADVLRILEYEIFYLQGLAQEKRRTPVETVAATAWAWIFFSERPTTQTVIGGVIVIAAIVWGTIGTRPTSAGEFVGRATTSGVEG